MKALGLSMRDKPTLPLTLQKPPPDVGITYLGQFVMHDLTRDDTPLGRKPLDPADVINHTTPFLDLHSLYGAGPLSDDCYLYEDDRTALRIGLICTKAGIPFDLPIDARINKPLLADSRNNENLFIRQIHAMFLKLHNIAVADLRGTVPAELLFQAARCRVQLQYQWMVREFLVHVCNPGVYKEVVGQQKHKIDWGEQFAVPVEFAHAVARFGHSMVREKYSINSQHFDIPLLTIFRETRKDGPLDPDFAIDWRIFRSTPAHSIDTSVIGTLFELGPKLVQPFVESLGWVESLKLPVRTLYRHITMGLPTGEEVRDFFDRTAVLTPPANYDPFKALNELGLRGKTPLWYYILLEAELNEGGANLGPIGSRLLLEVVEGALRATADSILPHIEQDPAWRPEEWKIPSGTIPINTLLDLAIVVGLAKIDDSVAPAVPQ
jgi:hypothetical protein